MADRKPIVVEQGSADYETYRRANVNPHPTPRYPQSIWLVKDEEEVVAALKYARAQKVSVGVRSGGHTYHHSFLLRNGILIDTSHLNRYIEYDSLRHEISFGPAVQVKEISDEMLKHERFFAHGHSPTVAAGGFLLAGGQGFFMRGWGATSPKWITRLRVVTPEGRVVTASEHENRDLFWAARGSGTAFFGVVTKFWGRTIPMKNLFAVSHTFTIGHKYQELMEWAFSASMKTPKYGTDMNIFTLYKENFDPTLKGDSIPSHAELMLGVAANAYAESLEEAQELLKFLSEIPDSLKSSLVESKPTAFDTWDNVWALQDALFGTQRKLNWQINSFLNNSDVPIPELVKSIKSAVCDLPTRFSISAIALADIEADESVAVLSLPQQVYISTFTAWKDEKLSPQIGKTMRNHYKALTSVANGMYIADYDPNCDDANQNVWTESALVRFLEIRQKWDPDGLFPHYKAIVNTQNRLKRVKGTHL